MGDVGNYHKVQDIKSGMISIHHFPKENSVEENLKTFQLKMNQRRERLIKYINHSEYILFISNRKNHSQQIADFCDFINNTFGKYIYYFNINNVEEYSKSDIKIIQTEIKKNKIFDFYFNDTHPLGGNLTTNLSFWLGNSKLWDLILSPVQLHKIFL